MSIRILSTLLLCGLISSGSVFAQESCKIESQTSKELSAFMEGASKGAALTSKASSSEDEGEFQWRIKQLTKQMETAESDLDRALAVYELKEIKSPIVPLVMKKALRDKSAEVRIAAVTSLHELTAQEEEADMGHSKYKSSIPELTVIINDSDEDGEVKDLAIASLLNMSSRTEDLGAMLAVSQLKKHSDERVRLALLTQTFSSLDGSYLFGNQGLISLLKNDPSEMVRVQAVLQLAEARYLTEKEKMALIAAFEEAAEKDPSPEIREGLAELAPNFKLETKESDNQ